MFFLLFFLIIYIPLFIISYLLFLFFFFFYLSLSGVIILFPLFLSSLFSIHSSRRSCSRYSHFLFVCLVFILVVALSFVFLIWSCFRFSCLSFFPFPLILVFLLYSYSLIVWFPLAHFLSYLHFQPSVSSPCFLRGHFEVLIHLYFKITAYIYFFYTDTFTYIYRKKSYYFPFKSNLT